MAYILKDNLISALRVAIDAVSAEEKERNGVDFESGLVSGWRNVLASLNADEHI